MDFNVITQSIGVHQTVFEGSAEQSVNLDITLHDYYPDIQRVLKCGIEPGITSVQSSAGKITADGTATVRVVYVGEDNAVHSFEQSSIFSKSAEVNSLPDGACVNVKAKTDYVNCRTVSQRRVNVGGMISLSFKARVKHDEKIITGAQGGGVQLKAQAVAAASVVGAAEKCFAVGEVVELGQGMPPITQIVRADASALIDDIKTVNNKLLIKGELRSNILYCADNDSGELVLFTHTMPISQIIEVEGVSEDSTSDIKLNVMQFEATPKSDSSGNLKLLDINARVCASINSYANEEIPVIADAYSVFHELKADYKQTEIQGISDVFKDSFMSKSTVEVAGGAVDIKDIWCAQPVVSNVACSSGLMKITGNVTAGILFSDREGKTDYAEKTLEFEYERQLKDCVDAVKCEPYIVVTGCTGIVGSEGRIDTRTEYDISAVVFSSQTQRVINSFELDEKSEPMGRSAALTIYFAGVDEDVWSIAKHYSTTVDAILQENSLADSVLHEDMMLMIPGA